MWLPERPALGHFATKGMPPALAKGECNALLQVRRGQSARVEILRQLRGAAAQPVPLVRLEDHLAELAHHYDRSCNLRRAVEYLARASRLAVQQTAHSGAVGF
jgi:hypothetical protein